LINETIAGESADEYNLLFFRLLIIMSELPATHGFSVLIFSENARPARITCKKTGILSFFSMKKNEKKFTSCFLEDVKFSPQLPITQESAQTGLKAI
jgi:hypothetical protein